MKARFFLGAALALAISSAGQGQTPTPPTTDWPQWRGPERNGISREVGLARQWPAAGPPVVWTVSGLGAGYGSVAIKGDRLYVQALRGRQSMVHSLNLADGK